MGGNKNKFSRFFQNGGKFWEQTENVYYKHGRKERIKVLSEVGDVGKLSPEIEQEWLLWRIWLKKGTPLNELKYDWTYIDLLKANALLDMEETNEIAVTEYQRTIS